MKEFRDLEYIDTSSYAGYIGFSTPGWEVISGGYVANYEDRPLLRITMTGAITEAVAELSVGGVLAGAVTFLKEYNDKPVWDVGDILRAAYVRGSYPQQLTSNWRNAQLAVSGYDSNGDLVATRTLAISVSGQALTLTAATYDMGPYAAGLSLPSRFRMPGDKAALVPADLVRGVTIAARGAQPFSVAGYNGSTQAWSGTFSNIDTKSVRLGYLCTRVVLKTVGGAEHTAAVESVNECPGGLVILRWWSRVAGGWKCVTLDYVREYVAGAAVTGYEREYAECCDGSGEWVLVARFPDATYNDYLYYCDMLTGSDLQLYRPQANAAATAAQQLDGVAVSMPDTWKPGEVKHMDVMITARRFGLWA